MSQGLSRIYIVLVLVLLTILSGCTPNTTNLKDAAETAGGDSIKASVDATLEAMREDATATPISDKGERGAPPPPPIGSTPSPESSPPNETGETCNPKKYMGVFGLDERVTFTGEQDGSSTDIYVMDANSWKKLPNTSGGDTEPKWSRDGSRIAYVSDGGASMGDIFVMGADGHNRVKIANTLYYEDSPVWSPDGEKIAFTSDRDGNWDIFVMEADGSDQTNITNSPSNEYSPTWSPDGSRIAFSSDLDGFDIYVINANGSNLANITNSPEGEFDPSWSPDAGKIAFSSDRDGTLNIHIMHSDGSNNTNLTYNSGSGQSQEPEWSPDESRIVFSDTGPCGHSAIWVMDSDGENIYLLWEFPNGDSYSPHWEPEKSTAIAADVSNLMTVTGRAMWHDQPLVEVEIFTLPQGSRGDDPPTAVGSVDADGYFTISFAVSDLQVDNVMIWAKGIDQDIFWSSGMSVEPSPGETVDIGDLHVAKRMTLLTPERNGWTTTTPTFTWEAFPDAVNYHIDVFDTTTNEAVLREDTGSATEYTSETLMLTTNTKYEWSVNAESASGIQIAYFSSFYFIVGPDPKLDLPLGSDGGVINYDLDIIRGITPDGAYYDGEALQTVVGIRGVPYEFIGWKIEGADETVYANIAWGDGEYQTIYSQELMQNSGVIAASHIYSSGGVYEGYIDVVSNGNSVANSSFIVFINEVSTETACDPTNPNDFIVSGFSFQGENDTFRKVDNLGNELGDTCGVEGLYQRPTVDNFYHKGIISEENGEYFWNNMGVSNWQLYPEFDLARFTTDSNNSYFSESPYFTLFRGDADVTIGLNRKRSTSTDDKN